MERQHAKDMEKLNKHIENQEKEVCFKFKFNFFIEPYPAVVAEWSKTPILQIQVASGRLGPRFESHLGDIQFLGGYIWYYPMRLRYISEEKCPEMQ